MKRILIVMLVLLMAAPVAYAKKYGGAEVPDTVTIEGKKLVLNGAGVRRKFGLVKVYAGALFLTNKSSDAEKILDADEPMMIRMHCIRAGVSPQKLIDSWNESFANITDNNTAPYQKQINKFNSAFTEETQEDQKYDITYLPSKGLVVFVDGVEKVAIADKKFKRLVFSIWLGDRPLDGGLKKLKNQMLGK